MFSKKFISAGIEFCDYDNFVPAPMFRKKFTINSLNGRYFFDICGLGFYELYINGRHITCSALTPFISNPNDILYYDNYDITEYLNVGENVIGIILGNGLMNCWGGYAWDFNKADWRNAPCVAFSLENNEKILFEADDATICTSSPIIYDDFRIGVYYDARLEKSGWNDIGFDDSGWKSSIIAKTPKGEPKYSGADNVIISEERKPISKKHFDETYYCFIGDRNYDGADERAKVKDAWVYDFGVNDTGICRLKIKGQAGQKIILRYGDSMNEDCFNIRTTIFSKFKKEDRILEYPQMDTYILKGDEEEIFIPPFTYHGFRYVFVEGIKENQATDDLLTYLVMRTDFSERGNFKCSNATINKLTEMTIRSDLSNYIFFPNDCPHREKNGWTADIALSSEHILLHSKAYDSLREWMFSVYKAQNEKGALPGIIPTAGWGFQWGNGPAWDRVCVDLPYYGYKYDGRKEMIFEAKDTIIKYIKYLSTRRNDKGLLAIGLGDWCQPKFNVPGFGILAPLVVTDSFIAFDIAQKASFIFAAIEDSASKKIADEFAKEMRESIINNLIDYKTMTVKGECQTSQVLAIEYGFFNKEQKPKAIEKLVEYIAEYDDHIWCGVIGGRYIFHILMENGYEDLALKMITRPDSPSYGSWIVEGNTTLCEAFHFEDWPYSSLNHHFWGDIYSLFVQKLAGLRPNPYVRDVNEFLIKPVFANELDFAEACYESPKGMVSVRWEKVKDDIRLFIKKTQEVYGDIDLSNTPFVFSDNSKIKKIKEGLFSLKRQDRKDLCI